MLLLAYKKNLLLIVMLSLITLLFYSFLPLTNTQNVIATNTTLYNEASNEKRGTPHYDYIIGKDHWPHYRVFFWVPKSATHFTPYADSGVNTNVSEHGDASKWSVVVTPEIKADRKLVFIYVPKTFVFLYGNDFEDVIHLNYY